MLTLLMWSFMLCASLFFFGHGLYAAAYGKNINRYSLVRVIVLGTAYLLMINASVTFSRLGMHDSLFGKFGVSAYAIPWLLSGFVYLYVILTGRFFWPRIKWTSFVYFAALLIMMTWFSSYSTAHVQLADASLYYFTGSILERISAELMVRQSIVSFGGPLLVSFFSSTFFIEPAKTVSVMSVVFSLLGAGVIFSLFKHFGYKHVLILSLISLYFLNRGIEVPVLIFISIFLVFVNSLKETVQDLSGIQKFNFGFIDVLLGMLLFSLATLSMIGFKAVILFCVFCFVFFLLLPQRRQATFLLLKVGLLAVVINPLMFALIFHAQ